MKRTIQIISAALFLGVTTCSLVLSASSTLAKARAVHVPPGALWSAVGVLELVSLAATLRWLTAEKLRGQVEAWVVSGLVLLVTGVAGVAAYGWFGLVAPSGVVAAVYLLHAALADVVAAEKAESQADTDIIAIPTNPAPDQSATELLPIASPPALAPELPVVRGVSPETVAAVAKLLEAEPKVGRPRLRTEFGVTDWQAKQLLEKLRGLKVVDGAA